MTTVSIITVAYNSGKTIRATIDSVVRQSYPHIEHIVIDGGSRDDTMDIVRSYGERISKHLSEPDAGLYDAMNKGLKLATGDLVGFLNSDDTLASADVISRIVAHFDATGTDAVYGDLDLVNSSGRIVRRWRSGQFSRLKYHFGWMTPHPCTYIRRSCFERYGGFRADLPIAADYELMLRFFYKYRANVSYLPTTFVTMAAGGLSNGSLSSIVRANTQVFRSWRVNGLWTSPTVIVMKPLSKLVQLRP